MGLPMLGMELLMLGMGLPMLDMVLLMQVRENIFRIISFLSWTVCWRLRCPGCRLRSPGRRLRLQPREQLRQSRQRLLCTAVRLLPGPQVGQSDWAAEVAVRHRQTSAGAPVASAGQSGPQSSSGSGSGVRPALLTLTILSSDLSRILVLVLMLALF